MSIKEKTTNFVKDKRKGEILQKNTSILHAIRTGNTHFISDIYRYLFFFLFFSVVTKTSEYIFTSDQVAIFFDKFNTV